MNKYVSMILILLFLVGCINHRIFIKQDIDVNTVESQPFDKEILLPFFLFGIFQTKKVNVFESCPKGKNPIYVLEKGSFISITLIYTPKTVYIWCQ